MYLSALLGAWHGSPFPTLGDLRDLVNFSGRQRLHPLQSEKARRSLLQLPLQLGVGMWPMPTQRARLLNEELVM